MARIETPRRVRGTQDIFGDEQRRFATVIETFERVRRLYCFQRVDLPVFEATEVFARSIGETTDVVSKEMYTFPDRGGDSLTLRPEFTAGIARAFLTEGWQQYAPLKVATSGAVFRYERPQKGRYRQFHQIDAEILGAPEPAADVELLVMADQLLHELGIAEGVTLQLNTLGDAETRDAWRAGLVAHFEAHRGDLSEDSLTRLEKNPMRILDSKDPRDRPIADAAPDIDAYLTADARAFFDAVTAGLDAAGVRWTRNPRLVRGLDYYRHTAFEFVTDRLGAQGTVLAGGRYDGLVESLGGASTAGVGWAAGVERLAMLLDEPAKATIDAVIVPMGAAAEARALGLLADLRRGGVAVDMAYKGKMKQRLAKADALGARYALILGDDELAAGVVAVKDLATGDQRKVAFADVAEALR
ncbi:histidine--tRNA ligase [Sphingomonas melonis TY]|jgi:histidyl-tRNA synthetase|uniref:Histidine--tRNA ligase n=1 Tax=Sphingomonas melonis TY TaxID=621456 RepID=A0A175Y3U8_9SPHN|nr:MULTISPECIES: histidine--tRNA ligase [Sphingomonas]ATI56229.1 histidine--tRNA ligase [Sphingomonas melonis]KZB95129.1 histidine--tRNA ligase [Sphingomonas melonis TY]MBI0530869.1 histidine--tRNA ligase [Sphingomonas sp. TX0522]MBX8845047.1 histidine--tRNA ligase [Sphingomonas melonis]MBX8854136.1 histidine--tRNA ligase [Sphingomonas melonis]